MARKAVVENNPKTFKKQPDVAALIAGAVALLGLVVWVGSSLMPLPQEEAVLADADTRAPAKDGESQPGSQTQSPTPSAPDPVASPALPPLRQITAGEPKPPPEPAQPSAKTPIKSVDPAPAKSPPSQTTRTPVPAPESAKGGGRFDAMRGRYTGNYFDASDMIGLTLVISSIENGVVKAAATLGGRGCEGQYPMQGTFQNNRLDLNATRKGGPAGDCPLSLSLAAQGNTLVGATGDGNKVQLSR